MFTKGILKCITLTLLIAVMGLAIPLPQIFHHHKNQISYAGKIKSAISEYEKPCCKVTEFFQHSSAIIQKQAFSFFNVNYRYQQNFYDSIVTDCDYITSNKAPPIA